MTTDTTRFHLLPEEINIIIFRKLRNFTDGLSFLSALSPRELSVTFKDWLDIIVYNKLDRDEWPVQKIMYAMEAVNVVRRSNEEEDGEDSADGTERERDDVSIGQKYALLVRLFNELNTRIDFLKPIRTMLQDSGDPSASREFIFDRDMDAAKLRGTLLPSRLLIVLTHMVVVFCQNSFYCVYKKSCSHARIKLPNDTNVDEIYGAFVFECSVSLLDKKRWIFVLCRVTGTRIVLVRFNASKINIFTLFNLSDAHELLDYRKSVEFKRCDRWLFVYMRHVERVFIYNSIGDVSFVINRARSYVSYDHLLDSMYVKVNDDHVYFIDGNNIVRVADDDRRMIGGDRTRPVHVDLPKNLRRDGDDDDSNNVIEIFHDLLLNNAPAFEGRARIGEQIQKMYVTDNMRSVCVHFSNDTDYKTDNMYNAFVYFSNGEGYCLFR